MRGKIIKQIIYFTVLILILIINWSGKPDKMKIKSIFWQKLDLGLHFADIKAPLKSIVGDSKISILKIDPYSYNFELITASEFDSIPKTAKNWAINQHLTAVINAGMYRLGNHLTATGYLKNFDHENNPTIRQDYRAMASFNKKDTNCQDFAIIDMEHQNWDSLKIHYQSFAQAIRMIDFYGKPLYWKVKPKMKSSMCVLAIDKQKNVLFIFTRSPYTVNQFINMLLAMPLNIHNAMYLEGGPEASLYIATKDTVIEKFGSYVSQTFSHNKNDHFWAIPNVIGIRKKQSEKFNN